MIRNMQTKDIRAILDVVGDAIRERKPLWQAAEDRISHNLMRLRDARKRARRAGRGWSDFEGTRSFSILSKIAESQARRVRIDNRRIRRLIKRFASLQKPSASALIEGRVGT